MAGAGGANSANGTRPTTSKVPPEAAGEQALIDAVEANGGSVLLPVANLLKKHADSHRMRITDLFNKTFDANGDGKISYGECRLGLKSILGYPVPPQLFARLCRELDKDGDKEIDYRELHDAVCLQTNAVLARRKSEAMAVKQQQLAEEAQKVKEKLRKAEEREKKIKQQAKLRERELFDAIAETGTTLRPVALLVKAQTDKSRKRLVDVFSTFDADNSGSVSYAELAAGITEILGFALSNDIFTRLPVGKN